MTRIRIALATATLATAAFFSACNKEDNAVFNASFYSTQAADGELSLYIDEVYKGKMPYLSAPPACGQTAEDGLTPLNLQLPSGSYKFVAKNAGGVAVSSSMVQVGKKYNRATSCGPGGLHMTIDGSCVTVGMWK